MLDDTPHRLAGITFYDGPPEEKASLVYDKTAKAAGKETMTWHFNARSDGQIWVVCSYAGTAVVLKRGLPPKTSACSVTYDSRASVPVIREHHRSGTESGDTDSAQPKAAT
jgi:hypothetical protein